MKNNDCNPPRKALLDQESESRFETTDVKASPEEIPLKALSVGEITARRHQLFVAFAVRSLDVLDEKQKDPAVACKLAETAFKALSEREREPETSAPSRNINAVRAFEADLKRAYAQN
jgi:hypothetical protein